MPNPIRIWQLLSLILAIALIAALAQLRQPATAKTPEGTLLIVNTTTGYEHLATSPKARRAHERYSL